MTMSPALWQRNLIGAVVVAAVLTLLAPTELLPPWQIYQSTVRPEHVVPAGQTGSALGQSWSVGQIRHLAGSPAPSGSW